MLEQLPIIDNRYYVALIAIFGFALTMVTTKGGLTNHTYTRRWWKRYTKRGRQAILLGILTILTLFLQDVNSQNASNLKDKNLKSEQDSRNDKITKGIKKGVEASTENLFKNLSKAFKKQGLQYDTIRNEVKRIRDSIKVTTVISDKPLISISNLEIIDSTFFGSKTYKVKYFITSHDAKCKNIDLKLDVYGITSNSVIRTIFTKNRILYKGQDINKNETLYNNCAIVKDETYYVKMKLIM